MKIKLGEIELKQLAKLKQEEYQDLIVSLIDHLNGKARTPEFTSSSILFDMIVGKQIEENTSMVVSEEKQKVKAEIREEIDSLIAEIKQQCGELGIAYNKAKERQFARHILTAKEYGEFSGKCGMSRKDFTLNIMRASLLINYWKGACAGPMSIYQNYSEVFNLSRKISEQRKLKEIPTL